MLLQELQRFGMPASSSMLICTRLWPEEAGYCMQHTVENPTPERHPHNSYVTRVQNPVCVRLCGYELVLSWSGASEKKQLLVFYYWAFQPNSPQFDPIEMNLESAAPQTSSPDMMPCHVLTWSLHVSTLCTCIPLKQPPPPPVTVYRCPGVTLCDDDDEAVVDAAAGVSSALTPVSHPEGVPLWNAHDNQ